MPTSMNEQVNILELKKQALFKEIDDRDLEKIAKKLQVIAVKEGEYLYRFGEERKGLYLIRQGRVDIMDVAGGGVEYTLFARGPGDFFGTFVVFGDKRHETSARVMEDTTIYLFPKEEFEALETDDVFIAYQIFKNLAHMFYTNTFKMYKRINELTTASLSRYFR